MALVVIHVSQPRPRACKVKLPLGASVNSKFTVKQIRRAALRQQLNLPQAVAVAARVGIRCSDDGSTFKEFADILKLLPPIADLTVQELLEKHGSFIVKLPDLGDVAESYQDKVDSLGVQVKALRNEQARQAERLEFLERHSEEYLKIARRSLLADTREKLMHHAQANAADAARRWNYYVACFSLDQNLLAACGLSVDAVFLTQRRPGSETEAGNIAAHEIPQAAVRAAIDELSPDVKRLWEELFRFVYGPTA